MFLARIRKPRSAALGVMCRQGDSRPRGLSNPVVSKYLAELVAGAPMTDHLPPVRLLLVTLAGWLNRHQQLVREYFVEENRVLKEQMKGRRIRLTDDRRRRLAAKGQRLGRRVLRQVAAIVTPDTSCGGTGG